MDILFGICNLLSFMAKKVHSDYTLAIYSLPWDVSENGQKAQSGKEDKALFWDQDQRQQFWI